MRSVPCAGMSQAALTDFGGDGGPADDGVEPIEPVYRFDPAGACDGCGEAADVCWRDGGDYVCPDCKDW